MNRVADFLRARTQCPKALMWTLFAGWLLMAGPVSAANPGVGTTGFAFLKMDVAARSAAMGNAFVAAQGDINCLAVNPAGLATIGGVAATATYMDYLLDTQLGFIAYARALDGKTAWGVAFRYMSYGDFQRTDSEHPAGEGLSSFGADDWALQLSLGRALLKDLFVGGTLKAVYSELDTYSSDGYAVDFGILFTVPGVDLSLGASVVNMGFVRQGYAPGTQEALPANMKLGFTYKLAHLPLLILGDMNLPNDNDPYSCIGGEFTVAGMMFLRAGYNSLHDDLGREAQLSFGTGLLWRKYQIDYAYSSLAELGKVHRISIAGRF